MNSQTSAGNEAENLSRIFSQHYWNIKLQWISSAIALIRQKHQINTNDELQKHFFSVLLESDITVYGSGGLPDNCSKIEKGFIKNPVVVQLESFRDISLSLQEEQNQIQARSQRGYKYPSKRTLSIRITDGIQTCSCLEIAPIPSIPPFPTPGCKFVLLCASIRHGILLIDKDSIIMLGGSCTRCVDEYNATVEMISSKLGLLKS